MLVFPAGTMLYDKAGSRSFEASNLKGKLLTLFTPPVAVCKHGCAGCCAAPIGVFWITGIVAIIYGLIGGPTNLMGPSLNTILLGGGLWGIATVWATIAIRSADEDRCRKSDSTLCHQILPTGEEPDPFDEVRKAR